MSEFPPALPDLDNLRTLAAEAVTYWSDKVSEAQRELDNAQEYVNRLSGEVADDLDEPEPEPKPKRNRETYYSPESRQKVLEDLAGHSYATAETVAKGARVSLSTARSVLRDAVEKGWVETWNRQRPKGSHPGRGRGVFKITDEGRDFLTRPDPPLLLLDARTEPHDATLRVTTFEPQAPQPAA